ncbi:hypothetical protein Kfla_1456 [Kribbella flavida DSM 17836]|uniref:Uncharacterized protein n=1 Tax=Kribbella flavida (strain DSM 17836 / JCM 10339 / NBRC 14399) TaxID=479435 RepID=D2PLC8_KRIFD|nr:hypothetical protein Kfla_1456 [Kribbella flavida DSM 17836]
MVNGPLPHRFLGPTGTDPVLAVAIAQGMQSERYQVDHFPEGSFRVSMSSWATSRSLVLVSWE